MKDILKIFTEDFMLEYKEFSSRERKSIVKGIPYFYRIWYYSTLIDNTPLSPSNFINLQIQDKFGKGVRVVPIINPIYKSRALKDFSFDFKLFTVEEHPVLEDMKLFLEHCSPDIGIDETGLLLDEERDEIINSLTFKEIFYATFLTNMAYELNLIKKMPSIGTYRAMPNSNNIHAFFSLSKAEQLERIAEAVITNASRAFGQAFSFDRITFSKKSLYKLLENSQSLDEYSNKIFKKFNANIDISALSELLFQPMSEESLEQIPEEDLFGIALNVEFSFIMDACLLTPLGHYLQLIQPIYNEEFDFFLNFDQLVQADFAKIPLIKFYFIIANGFDITSLGKEILLGGKSPKNEFQKLAGTDNFEHIYKEIMEYVYSSIDIDDDLEDEDEILTFGDFKTTRREMREIQEEIDAFVNPKRGRPKAKKNTEEDREDSLKDSGLIYTFKVKRFYNKRSYKSIELRGRQTLEDLAAAIIKAFDLDYGRLYSFFMSNKAYDEESEITSPIRSQGEEVTTNYYIYRLGLDKKKKFLFIYDFGDDIRFEVEFIKTSPFESGAKYPRVVKESKNN